MHAISWPEFSSKALRFIFTIAFVVFWTACADESQNLKGPDADASSAKGKSTENTNYSPSFSTTDGYTWTITIDQAGRKALSHMIIQMTGCDGALLSISDIENVEEVLPVGVMPPDGYTGLSVVDTEGSGTGCVVGLGHFVKIQNFVNKTGVLVIKITFSSKVTSISMLLKAGTFCTPVPFVSNQSVNCNECEKGETAWGAGSRYCSSGTWATYTTYVEGGSAILYAGQTYEAGKVDFSSDGINVTLTITLNPGWELDLDKYFGEADQTIKVQPYSSTPICYVQPGQFQYKSYSGSNGVYTVTIPGLPASYYGIHLDVTRPIDCPQ
jgi:hypothetical protein